MNKITKDIAEKYINEYFYQKYPISKKIQPRFWEAVILLCEDMDADVSSLIDETNLLCYCARSGRFYNILNLNLNLNVTTLNELAHKIASEIIEADSIPIKNVDFFVLQQKVEYLTKRVLYLSANKKRGY